MLQKHKSSSLQMFGANGQILQKWGKVVVESVDLKVIDAWTQIERSFKLTSEAADLGLVDETNIDMD